jgi:hypothetical protein
VLPPCGAAVGSIDLMRDPHVEFLRYRLAPDETWEYVNAPRLEGEIDAFRFDLENGTLILHMKKHFASVEEARASVTGFLFVWEVDAELRHGRGAIRFIFQDAQLVDRIPPPPGTFEAHMTGGALIVTGGVGTVRITSAVYPGPPTNMRSSPDLESLWLRYDGYRAKREPLSTMAYFCLTVLETAAGGRAQAAKQFNIEVDVLRKIGELTANRGDRTTARKMHANLVPYTPLEVSWIEEAIRLMIRRVAEIAAGATCAEITMKDLPAL